MEDCKIVSIIRKSALSERFSCPEVSRRILIVATRWLLIGSCRAKEESAHAVILFRKGCTVLDFLGSIAANTAEVFFLNNITEKFGRLHGFYPTGLPRIFQITSEP